MLQKKKFQPLYIFLAVIMVAGLVYYYVQLQNIIKFNASKPEGLKQAEQTGYTPPKEYKRERNTNDWNIYKNKLIGYEVKYPKDWLISEESFDSMGSPVTENSFFVDIYPKGIFKDFLWKVTIEATPDQLMTDGVIDPGKWNKIQENFKSWSLKDKKVNEVKINGVSYTLIEGTSTEAGIPEDFLSKTYLTKINKNQGTIAIIVRDRSYPRSGIFDQIVESFKFTNGQ